MKKRLGVEMTVLSSADRGHEPHRVGMGARHVPAVGRAR